MCVCVQRAKEDVWNQMPSGEYTTAEVRPNAYIPESDLLPLPKPYGAQPPFKPSQPGANMRHFRKPTVKPLETEDTTDWRAHKHHCIFMKSEVIGLDQVFNQNPESCQCPSEAFNLHLRNQQTFKNKWEFEFEFSIYFLRHFSFLSHMYWSTVSALPLLPAAPLGFLHIFSSLLSCIPVLFCHLCVYLWTASGCNCVSFFYIYWQEPVYALLAETLSTVGGWKGRQRT